MAPADGVMFTVTGFSGRIPPADAVPIWVSDALTLAIVKEQVDATIVVTSVALADADPPPETVT